jgi:DNA-binding response OmpR family regulator
MRVLLVEPDPNRRDELAGQLGQNNLDVRTAVNGEAALAALGERSFRVVILEHALDGGAGPLTQRIRAAGYGVPVVVLTDDADPAERVMLLDDGVDDVLVRPFPPEMLAAQVRSLMRRCAPNEGAVLKFEDLTLDLRSLQVTRQGRAIPSTSRELAVLEYLLRNRQRVISRQELSEAVWDDDTLPDSNVIEVFIARLRRKVDRPFGVPLIHTIVGRGYMLSMTKPGDQVAPPAGQ